jgi:hypothetical protein
MRKIQSIFLFSGANVLGFGHCSAREANEPDVLEDQIDIIAS